MAKVYLSKKGCIASPVIEATNTKGRHRLDNRIGLGDNLSENADDKDGTDPVTRDLSKQPMRFNSDTCSSGEGLSHLLCR